MVEIWKIIDKAVERLVVGENTNNGRDGRKTTPTEAFKGLLRVKTRSESDPG
ncbi:MAG: hypothetical protein R2822_19925 [Spirosomataceae bacterium]